MTDRIEVDPPRPRISALFTDHCELLCAYFEFGMTDGAVFVLFVLTLPLPNFLIACGQGDLLSDTETLRGLLGRLRREQKGRLCSRQYSLHETLERRSGRHSASRPISPICSISSTSLPRLRFKKS